MNLSQFILYVLSIVHSQAARNDWLGETNTLDSQKMAQFFNLLYRDGTLNLNTNQECLKENESRNLQLLAQAKDWSQDCQFKLHPDLIPSPTHCVNDNIGEWVHYSENQNSEIDVVIEAFQLEEEVYDLEYNLCESNDNIGQTICDSARQAYWYKADQVECATSHCTKADGINGLISPTGAYITVCAFSYKANPSVSPIQFGAPSASDCRNTSSEVDSFMATCCTENKDLNTCPEDEEIPCEDTMEHCQIFKDHNFCNFYPSLFKGCHKTCDFCLTLPPNVEESECADKHTTCTSMALQDKCYAYSWMRDVCPQTCGICETNCTDLYPECETEIARNNYCHLMSDIDKCAKACGVCGLNKIEFAKCKDRSRGCELLEKHCDNENIQDVCKVTCGVCIPNETNT